MIIMNNLRKIVQNKKEKNLRKEGRKNGKKSKIGG